MLYYFCGIITGLLVSIFLRLLNNSPKVKSIVTEAKKNMVEKASWLPQEEIGGNIKKLFEK